MGLGEGRGILGGEAFELGLYERDLDVGWGRGRQRRHGGTEEVGAGATARKGKEPEGARE